LQPYAALGALLRLEMVTTLGMQQRGEEFKI
jgi:hypothetical protein